MDKLNFSLDQLVADSRKSNNKAKSLKSRKMETKKAKVVKSSSSKSASNAKAKPARELRQPTAQQVAKSVTKVAADSVLSRLGPKLDECSIVISNLNYNISLGDVRELCATVGEVSKVFVHKDTGRADVTFKFKEDAKRAIQRYDRVTLDGRPMRVSMKDAGSASSTERASGSGPFSRDHAFGAARQSDPIPARKEINQPTTFSVTLAGLDNLKKKDNNVSKKPKAKANKPKAVATSDKKQNRREKPAPMDASSLDNDMDSYFAARSNKSTTEDA